MRSSSALNALLYDKRKGRKIGHGLEQIVELFGLFRVIFGRVRQVQEAILEPCIGQPRVRTAPGTLREGQQLAHRQVDFLEQRGAAHRFEQPPRREQGIRLGAAQLDLARHFTGANLPQEWAAAAGRHALQVVLALDFLQVAAHRAHRHRQRIGQVVQRDAARVLFQDLAQAIQPPMLSELALGPAARAFHELTVK